MLSVFKNEFVLIIIHSRKINNILFKFKILVCKPVLSNVDDSQRSNKPTFYVSVCYTKSCTEDSSNRLNLPIAFKQKNLPIVFKHRRQIGRYGWMTWFGFGVI